MNVAMEIIQAALIIILSPLIAGIIKKTKACLQNRRGSSIFQPYNDLAKLFAKDSVVSPTVSWIFRIAPYMYFAGAFAAAVIIGFSGSASPFADVLLLIYMLAIGRFFLALASLDAGSAFGGMGGSREMYIAVLVEPALLLALMTVAMRAGTTALPAMNAAAAGSPLSLPYILAAIAFFVVTIAEVGRVPVDNPDTHLELTMIHEGMVLEYSGRPLGLILLASMTKQLIVLLLFVNFFIPWEIPGGNLIQIAWFAGKLIAAAMLLAAIETSTNKMRLFRLPGFLAVSCLLSLLALVAQ